MNKKTFIAGLLIVGISLVITAIIAYLWSGLLEQPAGLLGLFVTVFLALAGLIGGTVREWAANLFGEKEKEAANKRQLNVGDNTINVITDEFVQNIFQVTSDQENAAFALFAIPKPVQDFTGREQELEQLKSEFKRGVVITSISGGGIGKTELARKLADELKDDYPDARMSIDLLGTSETPLAPEESMRRSLEPFYPNQKLPDEPEQLRGLYQQTFSSQKVLLLLDNAANVKQVRSLILPAPSATIVTSRQHFSLTEFGLKEPLRLDVLSPESSRELLLTASDKIKASTDSGVDELANLCGRLPLALRVAASILNDRPDWTLGILVKRLEDERTRLARLKREDDLDLNIEATLSLSYQLLTPEMQKSFRLLGVFPGQFWQRSAGDIWNIDDIHAIDGRLGFLVNHSLLNTYFSPVGVGEGAGIAYSLHDLTRLFAIDHLLENVEEAQEAVKRHADHYLIVASVAFRDFRKGGENLSLAINLFRAILPQLLTAWKRMLPKEKVWPRPESADRWLSVFPNYCVELLSICVSSSQLIPILKSSLDAARKINDKEHERLLLGNLGNAFYAFGYIDKAIEFYEQFLAIQGEFGDHARQGLTLGNIGNTYAVLGEFSKAIDFYEQALAIASDVGDRRNEGGWHINLGNIYIDVGDLQKALTHTQRGLSIHRELGERIGEAKALNNLGHVYSALSDIQTAIKYHHDALLIDREIGNRQGEGVALGNLAQAYLELGELEKAKTFGEQSLEIDREFNELISLGKALALLGLISISIGDREKAIAYTEESIETFENINSPHVEKAREQLINLQGAINVEEFVRNTVQAKRSKTPQVEHYYAMASKMARDASASVEIQELGKVLQKILVGVENPDLSHLPEKLAKLVKEELER